MQLDCGGICSIDEICTYLKNAGCSANAVRIDVGQIGNIKTPFITYARKEPNRIGHFEFCFPDTGDRIIHFDGAKTPVIIDTFVLQGATDKWDGTCILLDTRGLTETSLCTVAVANAAVWLVLATLFLRRRSVRLHRKEVM